MWYKEKYLISINYLYIIHYFLKVHLRTVNKLLACKMKKTGNLGYIPRQEVIILHALFKYFLLISSLMKTYTLFNISVFNKIYTSSVTI